MTTSSRNVRQAVHFALSACASAAAPLAFADAPAAANPDAVQEVVVTGSRIAQSPNDISISPINTVTAVDIQQTGLVRAEDILNNLPQVVAEQSSGTSISSLGIATVSLRGLGSQRTLVLINGRRMQPGGSGGVVGPGGSANSADINQIPASLIERADVLTGGASATYGADAVAGVVNFVLNTHYQGVKIDANYSFNNHKNNSEQYLGWLRDANQPIPQGTVNTGQTKDVSVLAGANFADGKGNATTYFTYTNALPAVGYQFDHAGCTLNAGDTPDSDIFCGGSSTSGSGRFNLPGQDAAGHAITLTSNTVDPVTGAYRKYNANTDSYNYGALSYLQRAGERYTAGAFLRYDISDYASVYTETMYARSSSTAQYGPSGAFAYTAYPLSSDNPLLTAEEVATLFTPANIASNHARFPNKALAANQINMYVGRRNVEGGGRLDQYTSNSIRQVLGVKGAFADAWTYDAYGTVGLTSFQNIEGNFLGVDQINNALDVVPNPATNGVAGVAAGAAVCRSALTGTAPGCVPWNIYSPGGVTADQLAYLSVPASYTSSSTEYIVDGSVTGDLGKYGIKIPTAKDGISINVGTEYREEKFKFDPDYIFANGLQAGGAPSEAIDGKLHVWEGFAEVRLPIANDLPFVKSLSMDAGYRYSNYTLGGTTNTYKFGVEWAPINDVRFRGGYNRAVRAPNLNELFQPATVGAGGTADPCWGPNPVLTAAQCARTGVDPNTQYGFIEVNPAAQINTLVGGTATLKPEIADTYTVGMVIQPEVVPNLIASVDVFYIKIRDTITSLSSNTVINDCALTGDPAFCGLIHRGAAGDLWFNTSNFVTAKYVNIGKISTRGLDFSAHHHIDIGQLGKLSTNFSGTYTKDFYIQPTPALGSYDCAGYWGTTCDKGPVPHWRHVLNETWSLPWLGIDLTARWRLIGPSKVDRSSSNPQLSTQYYLSTAHIPGYNYIDLSLAAPVTSNVDFRMGVNNLADKNPPLVLNGSLSDCPNTTCNDNTWVGTYDTLGRYLYAHVSVKF
jgi:outer membrane receptor protein involved in Fe transport